jgi:uncharacterized protein (TIGR00296 family)
MELFNMSNVYSDDDGKVLVHLARRTIEEYLQTKQRPALPDDAPKHLMDHSGVFVTLNSLRGNQVSLRGCIGRPYPTQPLLEATIDSAIDAAVNDPRFPSVSAKELDKIIVELSVLTPPKKIEYENPSQLLNLVKIGRDGLIANRGMNRGLLLPQVPVEWGWNVQQFLEHTCNKAWLPENAWKDPKIEFLSFQAEIFGEESPSGKIVRNPSHPRS